MKAVIKTNKNSAEIQLPCSRMQMSGALSYVGLDTPSTYEIRAKGISKFGCEIELYPQSQLDEWVRSQRRLFLNNNEADKAITDIKKLIGIIDKGPDKLTEFDEDIFEKIVAEITADESEIIQFKLIGGLVIKEKIERKKR